MPIPFGKGRFVWGEPLEVDASADSACIESKRYELQKALIQMTREAEVALEKA